MRWLWHFVDEALGVRLEGFVESGLSGCVDHVDLSVMHLVGRHEADTEMAVVTVVPIEEVSAEGLGVLDAAKAFGELRLVLMVLKAAPEKGLSFDV